MDRADVAPTAAPSLLRTVGPAQLALYGLGSMLGSGIYALIGTAAGQVGNAVWLSFLVALAAAILTALSYASLGARHPRAGGAAYVAERAYRMPLMGFMVGLAMICSGLTSVATQSRVFAANLAALIGMPEIPPVFLAFGFLLILGGVVFRGIRESMWLNVLCTVVEAGGLLVVIAVGISHWGNVDLLEMPLGAGDLAWLLVVQGAVLTFFAFIGFEDVLNVAEECREPERTIPIGILSAMAVAAVLYVAVAITAVSVVPAAELAAAPSPLTEVVARAAPTIPPVLFTAITMFAVANTALVNYVTASRLVYGLARQRLLPGLLGAIHPVRRTPHVAIALLLGLQLLLAAVGVIAELAAATVLLLLTVFAAVNAALFVLQRRRGEPPGRFEVSAIVPALGALLCAGLVVMRVASGAWLASALAGGMLAATFVLFLLLRPDRRAAPAPDTG